MQVSTNQMKRQEEENKRLQEALDTAEANIRTMQSQLGDHKRKYTDLESQASVHSTTHTNGHRTQCIHKHRTQWKHGGQRRLFKS